MEQRIERLEKEVKEIKKMIAAKVPLVTNEQFVEKLAHAVSNAVLDALTTQASSKN